MYTNKGKTHHNLLYDRGSVVKDRHMAVRALVSSSTDSEVYYNSLRRFRQRGIDDAAFVHDNELYSDSFVTNSFALGGDDNAVLKNNKIFGMGYHPIGIGWGRNFLAKDNFIYIWCFAPVQRSDEYSRKSSVAGMRFTNFESSPAENMIYEGNTIVLKATNNCTMARGIWTANSSDDKNIIYRHNTVKTEAMPGNLGVTEHPWDHHLIYYNGDVNNAIAPVTVQGGGSTSLIIPDTTVFEDNRFISNVSHIIIGEGYGIGSGVRFYRNTLEKIGRDSDHKFFYPVRIGFWYWNTFQNRIIDSILVNLAEEEIKPHFYGGSGNMEISYGKRKTFLFSDGSGNPVTNRSVTLNMPEGGISQTELTDAEGKASFDILSVMYYKYGDGKDGGYSFKNGNIDYSSYIFSASGYKPYTWMPSDSETLSLQSE
jgi:hypothetical protein